MEGQDSNALHGTLKSAMLCELCIVMVEVPCFCSSHSWPVPL